MGLCTATVIPGPRLAEGVYSECYRETVIGGGHPKDKAFPLGGDWWGVCTAETVILGR